MFGGLSCDKLELGPSIETKACEMESCPGETVPFQSLEQRPFRGDGGTKKTCTNIFISSLFNF